MESELEMAVHTCEELFRDLDFLPLSLESANEGVGGRRTARPVARLPHTSHAHDAHTVRACGTPASRPRVHGHPAPSDRCARPPARPAVGSDRRVRARATAI